MPCKAPLLRIAHREAINAVLYASDRLRRPVPRSWPRCDPSLHPTLRPVTLRACPRSSGLHESRQGSAKKVFGRGGLTSTPFPNRVSCVKARRNHGLAKAQRKRSIPQCVGRNRLRCGIRQAHRSAEPLPVNPAWGRGRHNVELRLECGVRLKQPHLIARRASLKNAAGGPSNAVSPRQVFPPAPPFPGVPPLKQGIPAGGQTFLGGNSTAFFAARPDGMEPS